MSLEYAICSIEVLEYNRHDNAMLSMSRGDKSLVISREVVTA